MIDLEKLEALAKAATPGPWVGRGNHIFCADNKRLVYVEAERALDLQTAAYIVAACNAVPELIAENRALRERVRELEEMSDRAIDEAGYLLGCMPTLDCRVCDYHDYCPEPMPGYEPDIETCRAAMRIFCDPKGAQISKKAAKETGK